MSSGVAKKSVRFMGQILLHVLVVSALLLPAAAAKVGIASTHLSNISVKNGLLMLWCTCIIFNSSLPGARRADMSANDSIVLGAEKM